MALATLAPALLLALPTPQDEILTVRLGGLDALVVDARDDGLRELVAAGGDRLGDLFAMMDAPGEVATMFSLLSDAVERPSTLRVAVDEAEAQPLQFSLVIDMVDAEDALSMLTRMQFLVESTGEEVSDLGDGLRAFRAGDAGRVLFGIEDGDPPRFVVHLGQGVQGLVAQGASDLPLGVEPAASVVVDLGAMADLFAVMGDLGPAEAAEMRAAMQGFGLGDAGLRISSSMGFDAEFLHMASRAHGAVASARDAGTWVETPLGDADFAAVPADATWAMLTTFDVPNFLDDFLPEEALEGLDEMEAELGVSLQWDLLDHLGTTVGVYAAPSSGGGGLLSTVGLVRVADEDGLREGLGKIEDTIRTLGELAADGMVAPRRETIAGADATVLAIPGLPIPVEVTWGVVDGWLVLGASPQAFGGAVEQLSGQFGDLRDHPGFTASMPARGRDAMQAVQFFDTPALMEDGYGWMTWVSAALSNALGTPEASARMLPGYRSLMRGARASVSVSYPDGDDLVTVGRADRSWTANATAMLGVPFVGAVVASAAAGAAVGAVMPRMMMGGMGDMGAFEEEDWDWDPVAIVEADFVEIEAALEEFALNNGGRYPDKLDVLFQPDANGFAYLDDYYSYDAWGWPYHYDPPTPDSDYRLYSLGADGEPGGEGENADLEY